MFIIKNKTQGDTRKSVFGDWVVTASPCPSIIDYFQVICQSLLNSIKVFPHWASLFLFIASGFSLNLQREFNFIRSFL